MTRQPVNYRSRRAPTIKQSNRAPAPIPTAQPLITWQALDAEFLRDDEDPDADNDAEEIAAEDELNHEAAMEDEDEQEAPASAAIAPAVIKCISRRRRAPRARRASLPRSPRPESALIT